MSLIYEALANVMQDVGHVAKRDKNTHQNFQFRGIDAVLNAVGPVLRKHRVTVMPTVHNVAYDDVQTSTGKPATACRVTVGYTFAASDGSELTAVVIGEAWDAGDKAAPKAMSVAFRTALLQALALPTDEPDPDSHSYERSKVDLAPLHGLIAEAKAAGLQGDYDGTLEWAAQAQSYADKACDKLRTAIANQASSDAGHGSGPASEEQTADGSSRSVGSARDETSSSSAAQSGEEVASPGGSPSTAVASSPDLPFDWEDYCREKRVTKVALMNALRAEWTRFLTGVGEADSKRSAPNKSTEIDEWADKYPLLVKAVVDDVARKAAA